MGSHVDLSSWRSRISELERAGPEDEADAEDELDLEKSAGAAAGVRSSASARAGAGRRGGRGGGSGAGERAGLITFEESNYAEHEPFKDGVLTIGCVGTAGLTQYIL